MSLTVFSVTFDASNAKAAAAFWAEALGRKIRDGADETFAVVEGNEFDLITR
jgi:hypothetical protein